MYVDVGQAATAITWIVELVGLAFLITALVLKIHKVITSGLMLTSPYVPENFSIVCVVLHLSSRAEISRATAQTPPATHLLCAGRTNTGGSRTTFYGTQTS
jgi:hypothetical protein